MKISALLLAGGKSRRMGEDKATLCFNGKPMWQVQLELLRSLQPPEILISAREDPIWRPADVKFVPDAPPSRGPLSGLAAALRDTCSSHLLALAIDMPSMSAAHLLFLCRQIEPGRGVVPMIGDRVEPLAAIYPVEAKIEFKTALSEADVSLRSLTKRLVNIGRVRTIQIPKHDQMLYWNLNEPTDLVSISTTGGSK